MPRVARDSDDETETKPAARKTRASSAAATSNSITDSPARRSTRSAKQLSTIESSPEIIEEINSQPTTRKTRSRAATLDKSVTLASRSLRSRKRSVSSDRSEPVEMESDTTQKRVTRKAASTAPGTPTKHNLRARSVRAGSEVKSTPPPSQAKRVTRASSVDPVGKNEESVSTPVKRRTRASMVPVIPTLTEEQEAKKKAVRSLNNTVTEIDEDDETVSLRLKKDLKKKSKPAKDKLDVIEVGKSSNDSEKPLMDASRKNEEIGNEIQSKSNEIDDKPSVSSFSLVYVDSTMGSSVITEDSKLSIDKIVTDTHEIRPHNSSDVEKRDDLVSSSDRFKMKSHNCSESLHCDATKQNHESYPNSPNSTKVAQNHDMPNVHLENRVQKDSKTLGAESGSMKQETMMSADLRGVDSTSREAVHSNSISNNFNALMNGKTAVVLLKDVIKEAHEVVVEHTFSSANVSDDSGNVSPTIIVLDDDDNDDECDVDLNNVEVVEDAGSMNSTIRIDAHNQVTEEHISFTNKENTETLTLVNEIEVEPEGKSPLTKKNIDEMKIKEILSSDSNEENSTVASIKKDEMPDCKSTSVVDDSVIDKPFVQDNTIEVITNSLSNITAEISAPKHGDVDISLSKKEENNLPNKLTATDIDTNKKNSDVTELGKDTLFSAVPDTDGEDASSSDSKKQSNKAKENNSMPKKSAEKNAKSAEEKTKLVAENTDSEDNLDDLFQDIPAEEWAANKPNDSANSHNENDIESTLSIHKDDCSLDESRFEDSEKVKNTRLSLEKREMNESLEQTASVCDDRSDEADESPEKFSKSPEKQRRFSKELKPKTSAEIHNLSQDGPESGKCGNSGDQGDTNKRQSLKKSPGKFGIGEEKSESPNYPKKLTPDAKKCKKLVREQKVEDSSDESMEVDEEYDNGDAHEKKETASLNASIKSTGKRRSSQSFATNSDFSLRLAPTDTPTNSTRKSLGDKSRNNSSCNYENQVESIKKCENEDEQSDIKLKKSRKSVDFMNKSNHSPLASNADGSLVMKMSTSLNDSKISKRNSLTKGIFQNSSENEEDTTNKENEKSLNKSGKIDNSDKRRSSLHNEAKGNTPSKNESLNLSSRKSMNKSINLSHIVDKDSSDSESDTKDEKRKTNASKSNKSLNKSRKSMELQKANVDDSEEIVQQEDDQAAKSDSSPGPKKEKKTPQDQIDSSKSVRRSIEAMKSSNPRKHDFSTIAEVGSSSDEYEIPNFIFQASSSDEDGSDDSEDEDDDDDDSKSIDSDVAKEMNLAGKKITKYSDDDVPGDDCRASEEDQSDSDDEGSDLDGFVVPDGEVEDSESDDDGDEEKASCSTSESDEIIAAIKASGNKVKALSDSKSSMNGSLKLSKSVGNKSLERSKISVNGSQNSSSDSDEEEVDVVNKSSSKDKSLNQSRDRKKLISNLSGSMQKVNEPQDSSSESDEDTNIDVLNKSNAKNKSLSDFKLLMNKSIEKSRSKNKKNPNSSKSLNIKEKHSNSESENGESELEIESKKDCTSKNESLNLSKSSKGKIPDALAEFRSKVARISFGQNSAETSSDDSDEEDIQSKNTSASKSLKNTSSIDVSNKSPDTSKLKNAFVTEWPDEVDSSSEESDKDKSGRGAGSKNPTLKVEPPSSESEAENGEDSYRVIVTKQEQKSHLLSVKDKKLIECSTPKPGITKKSDFSKTSDSFVDKSSATVADKSNISGRKSEGTIDLSDTKIMSKSILGASRTHDNSVKFNEVAEVVTPEAEVLTKLKPWKFVPLNQTAYPTSAESPDTKFLKKAKLNESYPILESMKSNEFDDLLSSTKKEGKKNKSLPTRSSEEVQDDEEILSSSKKSKKRKIKDLSTVQSGEEDIDTSTMKKSKKRPRVEDSSVQETEDSSQIKDSVEVVKNKKKKKRKEGKQVEVEENIENEIIEEVQIIKKSKKNKTKQMESEEVVEVVQSPDDVPKKKEKKKKNKNPVTTVEAPEEPVEEPVPEESEPKKKKKKKKNVQQFNEESQEVALVDGSESKKNPDLLSSLAQVLLEKKSKKPKKEPEPSADSSDEAPESLGFEDARRAALDSMKHLTESLNAQKQARKKKQSEHAERMLKEKLAAEERRTSIKRLPDDFLDQLGDAPIEARRPIKRQKLSITREKKQLTLLPSSSMFTPNTMVPATLRVDEAFRPLLSQAGSTTQFGVVNLAKVKKLVKKSQRAVQFRDKFLSRNPRQPMSAYNAYLLKQKAKGGFQER